MQITITPLQFAAMQIKAKAAPGVTLAPSTPVAGVLETSQITLEYIYDGISTLTIKTTTTHGLARFAPQTAIDQHITELIDQFIQEDGQ